MHQLAVEDACGLRQSADSGRVGGRHLTQRAREDGFLTKRSERPAKGTETSRQGFVSQVPHDVRDYATPSLGVVAQFIMTRPARVTMAKLILKIGSQFWQNGYDALSAPCA